MDASIKILKSVSATVYQINGSIQHLYTKKVSLSDEVIVQDEST